MAFVIGPSPDDEVLSTINTTPLVDVMLVLLIIFLITIPVALQAIPVQLPDVSHQPTRTQPDTLVITVDREGAIFVGMQKLRNPKDLLQTLKNVAVMKPQPEVHIRGDSLARYESIGRVVLACQRAGILKIGFITQPFAQDGRGV